MIFKIKAIISVIDLLLRWRRNLLPVKSYLNFHSMFRLISCHKCLGYI